MAKAASNIDGLPTYLPTSVPEVIKVALTGIGAGAAIVLLSELIARYFIDPVFCRSADSFAICAEGNMISFYAATVIVTIIAIAVLATIGMFRPLLIALASAAALWGVRAELEGLSLLEYGAWTALFFGLAYLLFFWLLRARSFVLSLVLTVIAVGVIRAIFLI
jgi:hypothetical protein